MKRIFLALLALASFMTISAQKPEIRWDKHSLIMDGKRVVPVMGEVHYSRIPESEWANEIRKMKEGGVTIIATYVFWNHIEEQQGIFDWSGQRNLRRFIELCEAEGLPVCLRIGPYCHGEVRCGGIPDWVVQSGCKLRSQDARFLAYTETLYRQIFTQIQGLQWKDGGPVLACQFDNEYGGDGAYLMALKGIAQRIGFDLPFYTRTGWPAMKKPTPFGEMIPLYGDYADGFWDRNTTEGSGNYWKAFHFSSSPTSGAIGSEQLDYSNGSGASVQAYPYFTCELGGGMMTAYHRRVYLYPEDAYSMALVKLGSGSNLLGYYMYHGGTNPEGHLTYLNECQKTLVTNYNDLPVKTYDFQAPLGEFGQCNPHYYGLRPLHLFMQDFGELLAPMEAQFPCADKEVKKHDDSYLRWSYRTADGKKAFVFVNNYERFANLSAKKGTQFEVCGVKFPQKPITVPASTMTIFPVNLPVGNATLTYATAQPIAQRDGKIWFEQKAGIPAEFCWKGKVQTVKRTSLEKPFATLGGIDLYLVSTVQAERLFLQNVEKDADRVLQSSMMNNQTLIYNKVKEMGALRAITIGGAKVAEEPVDADFDDAAVYRITLPADTVARQGLMQILYRGDVARLYAKGKLIGDNFYNGRPFLYGLWRLPADVTELELRILPLQKDMPVYFPKEADTTPGEEVKDIIITPKPQ
ncbi:MAG: beta-galactosidase [Bacteroidaceae bacterium]|nr:beta-galactosidase [Bacteroidaceae bacterium]